MNRQACIAVNCLLHMAENLALQEKIKYSNYNSDSIHSSGNKSFSEDLNHSTSRTT